MLMINAEMSLPTTELVPLLCLCLLTRSGSVFADGTGSDDPPILLREGDDAILPCSLSTKENIVQKLFDWKKDGQKEVFMYDAGVHYNNGRAGQDEQFKGRVSHFPEQLESGNASITIRNTKVTDSGNYTCEFPRLQPRQIFHIKLVVGPVLKDRTRENTGAAYKPYVTILSETKDGVLLQCEAKGLPAPHLEWQDKAGNIIPSKEPLIYKRDGQFNVTLQTTVSKSGHFRCIVTQEEIKHQIDAELYVPFSGAAYKPYVTILSETKDGVLLQCEAEGLPAPHLEWQDKAGNIIPSKEPLISKRDGQFYVTLQTTVSKSGHFRCIVTQEEIKHKIDAELYVPFSGSSIGYVVAVAVLAALIGVAVFGLLAYIIYKKVLGPPDVVRWQTASDGKDCRPE